MKKTIVTFIIGGLLLGMTACGNASQETAETVTEAETTTKTATTEQTEEASTEILESTTEESTEATETSTAQAETEQTESSTEVEEKTIFDTNAAIQKFTKLLNAREYLLENGDNIDLDCYYGAEQMSPGWSPNVVKWNGVVTKDGLNPEEDSLETTYLLVAVTSNYLYDYVNNDTGFYHFSDYISANTYDDIVNKFFVDGAEWTTDVSMFNAALVLKGLTDNAASLQPQELVTEAPFSIEKVSGIEVAYELPIYLNGEDLGLSAVFDKDGNMLNIVLAKDLDNWRVSSKYEAESYLKLNLFNN